MLLYYNFIVVLDTFYRVIKVVSYPNVLYVLDSRKYTDTVGFFITQKHPFKEPPPIFILLFRLFCFF